MSPERLAACARGELTLAEAASVPREALDAARALADECARGGREDLARELLEGLVALDDRDAWTWRALARVCLQLADPSMARVCAQRALGLVRDDSEAQLLLSRALAALGAHDDARAWALAAARSSDARIARAAGALVQQLGASPGGR